MPKLILKPKISAPRKNIVHRKEVDFEMNDIMQRFLLPLPEDLPLLKEHYVGEYFQRIDGWSVVQRWKDSDTGIDHHKLLFYPSKICQEHIINLENDKTNRNFYCLLLWKMLQKHGNASYNQIPEDVTYSDFDKYLNNTPSKRIKLKLKPFLRLKLKEAV